MPYKFCVQALVSGIVILRLLPVYITTSFYKVLTYNFQTQILELKFFFAQQFYWKLSRNSATESSASSSWNVDLRAMIGRHYRPNPKLFRLYQTVPINHVDLPPFSFQHFSFALLDVKEVSGRRRKVFSLLAKEVINVHPHSEAELSSIICIWAIVVALAGIDATFNRRQAHTWQHSHVSNSQISPRSRRGFAS